jgi:hypothetical protein
MSKQIRPSLSVARDQCRFGEPGERNARTNVGMVYLGKKAHLGRCHRVLFRKEQLELENAIFGANIGIRDSERPPQKVKQTDSGTDCRPGLGWSRRNTSGCLHAEQQRFQAQGLPPDAPFPVVWRMRSENRGSVLGPHTLIIRCDGASVKAGYICGLQRDTPSGETWHR